MVRRSFLALCAGVACWLPACVKVDASKTEKTRKRHLVGDEQFGIWLTMIAQSGGIEDLARLGVRGEPSHEWFAKDRRDRRRLRAVMRSPRAKRSLLATLRERYETAEVGSLDDVLAWLLENWTVVIELVAVLVKLFLLLVASATRDVGILVFEGDTGDGPLRRDQDGRAVRVWGLTRYLGEDLA